MLALGGSLAHSQTAYRAWGVLAGAIILIQGFLLVGVMLFLGTNTSGSLVASLAGNPWLCAGFALWLGCLVARAVYFARGRKQFAGPIEPGAAKNPGDQRPPQTNTPL